MSFVEDLSPFFNVSEHADTAIYDGATSVIGILDKNYSDVFQGGEFIGVNSQKPVFTYAFADLPNPEPGRTIYIGSDEYVVREYEQDRGIGRLILEAVAGGVPPPVLNNVFSDDFSQDFD